MSNRSRGEAGVAKIPSYVKLREFMIDLVFEVVMCSSVLTNICHHQYDRMHCRIIPCVGADNEFESV